MTPTEPPWTGFITDILNYSGLELYIEKILLFGMVGFFLNWMQTFVPIVLSYITTTA